MYDELIDIIKKNSGIVFFGGAGVSTESGIPDFRGKNGIYSMEYEYSPEDILSRKFFEEKPEEFFRFYRKNILHPNAKPNASHYALAKLEKMGKLSAVITQNIDGLHRAAGSNRVYELHGSVYYNYCTECGKSYSVEYISEGTGIPRCECGGIIKPDVVLYDEPLDRYIYDMSKAFCECADVLIVGGTSLRVYPAAGLIDSFMGSRLVIINRDGTAFDSEADILIRGSIADVFSSVMDNINR